MPLSSLVVAARKLSHQTTPSSTTSTTTTTTDAANSKLRSQPPVSLLPSTPPLPIRRKINFGPSKNVRKGMTTTYTTKTKGKFARNDVFSPVPRLQWSASPTRVFDNEIPNCVHSDPEESYLGHTYSNDDGETTKSHYSKVGNDSTVSRELQFHFQGADSHGESNDKQEQDKQNINKNNKFAASKNKTNRTSTVTTRTTRTTNRQPARTTTRKGKVIQPLTPVELSLLLILMFPVLKVVLEVLRKKS